MKVGLEAVVSYLPETIVKREERSYLDCLIPEEHLALFKGPEEVRELRDENAVEIMAEGVTRKVLEAASLQPSDIDFIISGNIGGKQVFPMVGTYIHDKIGFKKDTPVVNIQNFCASFVDGIHLAWNLVLGGHYKKVLVSVVTSCGHDIAKTGWGIDHTSPPAKFVGDGAGAAIVSAQHLKCEFLSYTNRTCGERYNHSRMLNTPIMNPALKEIAGVQADSGVFLTMDQWAMDFGVLLGKDHMMPTIHEALEKAGLNLSDIDIAIIHHPVAALHDQWVKDGIEAGIGKEKWKLGYDKIGNCGNVDIAYVLAELSEHGSIRSGSVIMLYAPGLGGHCPCMIVRWL
ncbi:MAG: ketoacyl-ACP synthase III family protein [Syntrophorhabdaceae bacterium]|nr:ketoacyl-ACP synthase III family protein [Syntrophorhabdaceae bacterium]MDD5242854.1 ketoacyl-ACP synthase III family protein [Syntrophorhabdaceae bacterium]